MPEKKPLEAIQATRNTRASGQPIPANTAYKVGDGISEKDARALLSNNAAIQVPAADVDKLNKAAKKAAAEAATAAADVASARETIAALKDELATERDALAEMKLAYEGANATNEALTQQVEELQGRLAELQPK